MTSRTTFERTFGGGQVDIGLFALRLGLALLIGGLMGLERQFHRRMAGTRTHALVAAGAAAFVMTAPLIPGDPSAQGRIVSYVVSGVGFLGAGVIFKEGGQVQGLNTAASIWCAAAVGTLSGLGFPLYAAVTAAGVLIVNAALRPLAYKFRANVSEEAPQVESRYLFEFACQGPDESKLRKLLLIRTDRGQVGLHGLHSEENQPDSGRLVKAELRTVRRDDHSIEELAVRFSLEQAVNSVRWHLLPVAEEGLRETEFRAERAAGA